MHNFLIIKQLSGVHVITFITALFRQKEGSWKEKDIGKSVVNSWLSINVKFSLGNVFHMSVDSKQGLPFTFL